MRRMAAIGTALIVLAACTSTGSIRASGTPSVRSPSRSSSPPPSASAARCHGIVARDRLRYSIDRRVSAVVAAEIRRETRTARGAYRIGTPVCGRGLVRVVVSARPHGAVVANTTSNGHEVFTIRVWTGGAPWRDAPEDLRPLILLHEWYHVVQFSFLDCTDGAAPCVPSTHPPLWLLEGSAQYEAERIGGAMGIGGGYEARRTTEIREAALVPTPLRRLRRVTGAGYALAFAAVELLVSRSGESSLVHFWQLTRKTGAWHRAFRSAFGASVRDFETSFERYRTAGFPR